MPRIIDEDVREFYDPNSPDSMMREYVRLKESMSHMETRSKELRDNIIAHVETHGQEDESGNIVLDLKKPLDGVVRFIKTRRTSRKLDETRAEEIIADHGIEEQAYKTIRVIDEDALLAMRFDETLTEDELDQMFPVTVTWALNTKK
jgi:DNA mismatch repair ATPase MutS